MLATTLTTLCDSLAVRLPAPNARAGRTPVTGAAIDSRRVAPGHLFFALPGTRTHGEQFAADALRAGACAVVSENRCPNASLTPFWIQVDSVLDTLQHAARWNRARSTARVIGLTGSVGKTTTRQMVSCVLSSHASGMQSEANYNNHLGVPLTLLRLTESHAWAAVEMGASQTGEIAELAHIAQPSLGIVTRVAPAHVAGFGSIVAIQRGKQELAEALPADGMLFLNADDPRVLAMREATLAGVTTFGESPSADLQATDVQWQSCRLMFRCDGSHFQVAASGKQLLTSALAAIALGRFHGMADHQIAAGLRDFRPERGRGGLLRAGGVTIMDDSYNASPASVAAAIESASRLRAGGRRVLVLGDMLELGDDEVPAHTSLGRRLALSTVDHIFLFGRNSGVVAEAACNSGLEKSRITTVDSLPALSDAVDAFVRAGDFVVVKGSRGNRLDLCIQQLAERLDPAASEELAA